MLLTKATSEDAQRSFGGELTSCKSQSRLSMIVSPIMTRRPIVLFVMLLQEQRTSYLPLLFVLYLTSSVL